MEICGKNIQLISGMIAFIVILTQKYPLSKNYSLNTKSLPGPRVRAPIFEPIFLPQIIPQTSSTFSFLSGGSTASSPVKCRLKLSSGSSILTSPNYVRQNRRTPPQLPAQLAQVQPPVVAVSIPALTPRISHKALRGWGTVPIAMPRLTRKSYLPRTLKVRLQVIGLPIFRPIWPLLSLCIGGKC
jgi:hypothetical protein